jgi:hypothetical protein
VLGQRMAEHVELALIPSGDDVEPGAAAADVIDGDQRLGGKHRMHHRHMDRRKDRDLLRHRAQCGGKRKGLEAQRADIAFAAKSLPARNRQDELEAGAIDHLGDVGDLRPAGLPSLGYFRNRNPAVGVEREQAKLQPVGIVKRVGELRHAVSLMLASGGREGTGILRREVGGCKWGVISRPPSLR